MGVLFQRTTFVLSAASSKQFIRDRKPQIVFAGRSNVGKSSLINCLCSQKKLAKVGAQPGKTTQINYFDLDKKGYLVDLPGYGFAKVSKEEKERWGKLMESYFLEHVDLMFGVLIVDARHAPTDDDVQMLQWFVQNRCDVVVVANKADKCKKTELEANIAQIKETLGEGIPVIPFSAEKGTGKEKLLSILSAQFT